MGFRKYIFTVYMYKEHSSFGGTRRKKDVEMKILLISMINECSLHLQLTRIVSTVTYNWNLKVQLNTDA
jgi:hypothetical protein